MKRTYKLSAEGREKLRKASLELINSPEKLQERLERLERGKYLKLKEKYGNSEFEPVNDEEKQPPSQIS